MIIWIIFIIGIVCMILAFQQSHSPSLESFTPDDSSTPIESQQQSLQYVNTQFHNDYREVINAIQSIVCTKCDDDIKFNPIKPDAIVHQLVNGFIDHLNKNPGTFDWNAPKSGWEKVQESLGLPSSLYEPPKPPAHIKLIKIIKAYQSDNSRKYMCYFIVQKQNVIDQMILRVQFGNKIESVFIAGFLVELD